MHVTALLRFFTPMPPAARLRLLLLVATGLFALVVRFVLLTPNQAVGGIRLLGYWAIAAIVGTAVFVAARSFRHWRFSWSRHGGPLLAAVACALFLQIHEPRKFKVIYDEYVILTTSLEMHLEREVRVPTEAEFNGRIFHVSGFVDKRPFLFAFLLSLFHDIAGYRVPNVFVLNGLISLGLFWLVFWLGDAIGGRRVGYAGMILMAGIPLVANVATSGGFDLLNLTLLAALMLVARRYLEEPTAENQNLLVMTGVLIAQTRYESILFVVSVAVIVAHSWWRMRRIEITRLAVLSPLMLLLPLLCNLVHVSFDAFTRNDDATIEVFELANFGPNLGRAVYYLFDLSGSQTNSPLVSYAGGGALLLVLVGARSVFARATSRPGMALVFFAFVPVAIGNIVLLLFYWWGHLDDPVASRLALPLLYSLVLALLIGVAQIRDRQRAAAVLAGLALLSILAWTVPINARHEATLKMFKSTEVEWQLAEVFDRFDHRTLIASESSLPLIAYRRPSVPFVTLNTDPKRYWKLKEDGFYEQIVIFQTFDVDPLTGKEVDITSNPIPASLKLEKLFETRFRQNLVSRFSLWVGFEDDSSTKEVVAAGKDL